MNTQREGGMLLGYLGSFMARKRKVQNKVGSMTVVVFCWFVLRGKVGSATGLFLCFWTGPMQCQ